jgi:RimJ/RimL family protein N-acetyltransferase
MTARIHLEPATVDHVRALVDGVDAFRERFGLTVVPGYLEFDGVIERLLRDLEAGADPTWGSQLFVHDGDRSLIGLGGYKGAPADGVVEIGYGIAPAYRHQGYATEAATLMVDRARAAGVTTVIAHTLAEPSFSTRVLTGLGFEHTATVEDPDDGPIWRWERSLTGP